MLRHLDYVFQAFNSNSQTEVGLDHKIEELKKLTECI